jgi:TonB-linked SusC/RagA family outer membrane protein
MKRKSKIRAGWLRFFVLSFIFVFCSSIPAVAQNGIKITGKIVDNTQMEVIGANVLVKGTSIGAINGEYTIVVPDEKAILVFSFIGYQKQEIAVGKNRTVNVTLKDDSQSLDEVVVVAYGTQTKATLTGALSSIDTKELLKAPVASISNVLAGAMPGVSTVQTSGQPGDDAASIFVRGSGSLSGGASSPLILVDGVEREFSQIDPNEIENLSILKDASATAVFGVRGANGVVLVTTRRGKSGKPTINVSTITGVQQPLSYVQQTGSYEFARYWNMKQQNDRVTDKAMYFTREAIEAYRTGSDPIMYPNTKWGDYMYNDLFIQSKNNINISGGNEAVKYFVSLSYLYQNGILKQFDALPYDNNFKYNRYNYRANLDFKLTRTTTMKLNIGGNVGQKQEPRASSDNPWVYTQIWALPFAGPGIVNGVRTMTPGALTPVGVSRDGLSIYWGQGYNQEYKTTLNTDVDITQKLDILTKGLSVSVKASYDNMFRLNKYRTGGTVESQTAYYKSFMDDSTKPQTDPDYDKTIVYVPNGSITPLNYSEDYGRDRNWYIEGRINYDRTFNKDHKVTALFLYNQSRNYYPKKSDGTDATYQYMPRGYVGFVGRATYGYKSKYLIDVNAGYNGSENFAPGKNRYGLFPSASVGWIMSEEAFMQPLRKVISKLKLRASYGQVGNANLGGRRFAYLSTITDDYDTLNMYKWGLDSSYGLTGMAEGEFAVQDLTWEIVNKMNLGVELGFLNGMIDLQLDYFDERRKDIFMPRESVPMTAGFMKQPWKNFGKVTNQGVEVSLNVNKQFGKDLFVSLMGTFTYAHNEITEKDEPSAVVGTNRAETGHPVGQLTGYIAEGLFTEDDFEDVSTGKLKEGIPTQSFVSKLRPGDIRYRDVNGDGKVDVFDKSPIGGTKDPEIVYGFGLNMKYKDLDFGALFQGIGRSWNILGSSIIPGANRGVTGNMFTNANDRWTVDNPSQNVFYPRLDDGINSNNNQPSTWWLRNMSFLRLKNIELGYSLPKNLWRNTTVISGIRLFVRGTNLLTFSKFDLWDPEVENTTGAAYPIMKSLSAGFEIKF